MTKPLLVVAAAYLALIGLALLLVPARFGVGAVPADPSPELLALLRLLGGPMLGIAVLNWLTRGASPSAVANAVLLANLVGFGALALARHEGLRSVAFLAVLGVALTYVSTSVFFPLALQVFGRIDRPSGEPLVD